MLLLKSTAWYTFFIYHCLKPVVMNSIDDFKIASFEKKCDFITMGTDYIASRCLNDVKMYLYHTKAFFIEVQYSVPFKKVICIHAFNDLKSLDYYAEEVLLNDLALS